MKLLGAPQPNLPPTEPPHQGFSSSGQPEQVHGPPGPPSPRGRRRREAAAMAAARGSLTAALRRRGAGHVTQREREGALQAGAGPRGRGRASRSAPRRRRGWESAPQRMLGVVSARGALRPPRQRSGLPRPAPCPRAAAPCHGSSFCRRGSSSSLVCGEGWAEKGRGAAPRRTTAPGVRRARAT